MVLLSWLLANELDCVMTASKLIRAEVASLLHFAWEATAAIGWQLVWRDLRGGFPRGPNVARSIAGRVGRLGVRPWSPPPTRQPGHGCDPDFSMSCEGRK